MSKIIHKVERRIPDFNLKTQFGNVPKEWLDEIEPHVQREIDGCWNWTGAFTENGYPRMQYFDYERGGYFHIPAHVRVAQIFWNFERDKCRVRRSCNNRACVRPSHVRPTYYHHTQTDKLTET